MIIKIIGFILILTTVFPLSIKESFANDSTSHPTDTGIEFIKNDDISIEKETLFLNERSVEVEYEFYNHTSKEVIVPMAFPLPSSDPPLGYDNEPKAWNFRVFVNDKKDENVKLEWRALVHDVDKAIILKRLGIPIDERSIISYDYQDERGITNNIECFNRELSKEEQDLLLKEGLIHIVSKPENCLYPNWIAQAVYLWEAKFPPQKVTKVKHTYDQWPGSWTCDPKDTGEGYQCNEGRKELQEAFNKFGRVPLDTYFYEYVIHTGGNWKGPIKKFKFTAHGPNGSLTAVNAPFPIKRVSDNILTADLDNYKPLSRTEVEKQRRTKSLFEMDDSVIWFIYVKKHKASTQ